MLLLVGGKDQEADLYPSQCLQCFDNKAGGWGRLADMSMERPFGCGAAAVGTFLFAFGGGKGEEPQYTTIYDMATRRTVEAAKSKGENLKEIRRRCWQRCLRQYSWQNHNQRKKKKLRLMRRWHSRVLQSD